MDVFATLDSFDRAILDIVQRDATLTHEEIGGRVNLSASSVRRRLKRLIETGIIQKQVALLDPDVAGVTLIVSVRFADETLDAYQAFDEFIADDAHVKVAYHVAGQEDYVLIVHGPSLTWYEDWAKSAIMTNPAVQRYSTTVVWSQKKFETALAL